ncbi:DUF5696 domain-containing protein [Paenibacillus sp. Root444D2]|uniref:DUF5696 domain-containing protein n=1 Tax=Paenibacillus sp. Root444D2 TaxID=1736538 RepID=UPI0007090495|nr:DUF5696 domain-containing protein [Paenibacillus sp. Root444D2]KQX55699.1 hypothetical protein ASD40_33305 [Paenibacillus sp. Root444D2]
MSSKMKISLGILSAGLVACSLIVIYSQDQSVSMAEAQSQVKSILPDQAGKRNPVTAASAEVRAGSGMVAVSSNTAEEQRALQAMELVAQNEILMLYVKRETAEVAVKDKRDGYIWFSNPVDREKDPKASPLYKSELSSQLLVTYYNEKGQLNTFNSYDDSVKKKQFKISSVDKGIKIVYQLGNIPKDYGNIPKVIGKQRFEERILGKLTDKDTREDVAFKFRYDEQKQVYEVRKLQDFVAEELSKKLEVIGYTNEEAAKDNKDNGAGGSAQEEGPRFTVPLEYTLDGEHLVVKTAGKELQYTNAYPIAMLQLLKYFGAADDKKDGYMFVPDGSGALIHLNNNKKNAEAYNLPVYGSDGTYDVKEKIQTNETTRLPVFGIKQNDHAMLGMIEGGDALANITADISGRNDSYNTVGGKFRVMDMDFYTLTSGTKKSSVPMFGQKPFQGDYQIRYDFLSGPSSDYTAMAGKYREYLVNKHGLKKLEPAKASPFLLEVEGAFQKQASFVGVPYQSTEALTTFDETQSMLTALKEKGVKDIGLRYVGWFNDGIRHTSPSNVDVVSELGGKKGLNKLIDYVSKENIHLFLDVAFLEKYKGASDAASFLDRQKAKIYKYDPVMYVKDTSKFSHYLLSPSALAKTVDGFVSDYEKLGLTGLSLRDLGNEVNSDFNPDHPINRQEALNIAALETEKLKQRANNLMVNGGNAYSLPYANMIVNAPTKSSRLNLTDEDVPFYQIALHGFYDLAGEPFNMQSVTDSRDSLLKALETGSDIYYQWYYSDSSAVKDSDYNELYALHYRDWLDQAAGFYKEASTVLNEVRQYVITDHRKLAEGVVQTTFENGKKIIINYNSAAVQVNDKQLEAKSYWVGGE